MPGFLRGFGEFMQKPEALTTLSRADSINNIYHEINVLPPAIDGQAVRLLHRELQVRR